MTATYSHVAVGQRDSALFQSPPMVASKSSPTLACRLARLRRLSRRCRYSVIDVETTGLDPKTDRIIEIAIVGLDPHGQVTDEFSTLIDVPGLLEVGPAWIHGIGRSDLRGAPQFVDLVPTITSRLQGTVVVGHVVKFDLSHLHSEFARANVEFPDLGRQVVCTRDLARRYLPPGPRSLSACCAITGIDHRDAHTALGDARSTATLFARFLRGDDRFQLPSYRDLRRAQWASTTEATQPMLLSRSAGAATDAADTTPTEL